jgi:hypothetical protein
METMTVRPGDPNVAAGSTAVDSSVASRPPARRRRRGALFGALAGAATFGLVLGVDTLSAAAVPPSDAVVFPETVASYAQFTTAGEPDSAALLTYQNGFGVEFLDDPQQITMSVDGSTFRRLAAAEWRGTGADQGDPAQTLLAPDGTFVVIAGADGQGSLRIEAFGAGEDRDLPVGDGRSALPLSIGGDSVLVLTSEETISPYTDANFRLRGDLELVDLVSGARTDLGLTDVDSGALSPDGGTVAAMAASGPVVIDVDTATATPLTSVDRSAYVGGDAWSPDGTRFALVDRAGVQVVDAAGAAADVKAHPDDDGWTSVLGWRDDETLLVQTSDPSSAAQFAWLDVETGASTVFSTYDPGFTGAAMADVDVARDLIGAWTVRSVSADQGPMGAVLLGVGAGLVVGLVVWLVLLRRSVHRDGALG